MGIHVNIGEAKTRLSELIAAAMRGEQVVIARAGEAQVRLEPITREAVLAARKAERSHWFGGLETSLPVGAGELFLEPEYTDEELDSFGL